MDLKIYDYSDPTINNHIIGLTNRIFGSDFTDNFNLWLVENPFGISTGVLAVIDGEIVGHFGVAPLKCSVKGKCEKGLISMLAMMHPNYQRKGLFKIMSNYLITFLENETDFEFIITFPNDNSLHVFVKYMGHQFIRDFNFIIFKNEGLFWRNRYARCSSISSEEINENKIHIERSSVYFNWRYRNQDKYKYYQDDNGNQYVTTRFNEKIDIVYWNQKARVEDVYDFAQFQYQIENVSKISTWDSLDFVNMVESRAERNYHFCIRPLKPDLFHNDFLKDSENWVFLMGDCEMF